jgi:hypothetical protein
MRCSRSATCKLGKTQEKSGIEPVALAAFTLTIERRSGQAKGESIPKPGNGLRRISGGSNPPPRYAGEGLGEGHIELTVGQFSLILENPPLAPPCKGGGFQPPPPNSDTLTRPCRSGYLVGFGRSG